MFGQSMATFVPPMLARHGRVLARLQPGGNPPADQVAAHLGARVRAEGARRAARARPARAARSRRSPIRSRASTGRWRWWRYREVHRLFGWKFWCIVCGAAPLDPELEAFWRKLGFLVVQGYGLTETAPIVTLNHPFRASKGTVGTPIGGVEVKIAPDGEILVRGDNVTSGTTARGGRRRRRAGPRAGVARGVQGRLVSHRRHRRARRVGRLLIKGRKKEMIVTPQGLNVFPEDVERALLAQPGVKDAGVVGLRVSGEERIHAVLVPRRRRRRATRSSAAPTRRSKIISASGARRSGRATSLPRTEGTQKLKRRELQRWAAGETVARPAAAARGATVEDVVGRFAAGRDVTPETTLDELGLSSLDRVELMMALEEAFQTTLDEAAARRREDRSRIWALVGSGFRGSTVRRAGAWRVQGFDGFESRGVRTG